MYTVTQTQCDCKLRVFESLLLTVKVGVALAKRLISITQAQ